MSPHRLTSLCYLLPLAWLWWRLVDQLRIEWNVNPQYAYGWAVPFLCAYLLWQRVRTPDVRSQRAEGGRQKAEDGGRTPDDGSRRADDGVQTSGFRLSGFSFQLLFWCIALLYFPTRLIQEANPDWRMVSWALALEVIGLTLLLLGKIAEGGGQRTEGSHLTPTLSPARRGRFELRSSNFQLRNIVFPICFFLVAVPWPTVLEAPVVQFLTRANAAVTIELLNTLGIPALQRGNVIEISTGLVGIDDACSGIRSLQATLMISLFLGELYRLSVFRRVALCLSGFALAVVFNIGRTFLLVYVASRDGIAAIGKWHDPAGVTILVGCFLGLWVIGMWLARLSKPEVRGRLPDASRPMPGTGEPQASTLGPRPSTSIAFQRLTLVLIAWIIITEVAVEAWYRSHERSLGAPVEWAVKLPNEAIGFKTLTIPDASRQMLRYDEGKNAQWSDENALWQVIYLRWNAGRIAAHLARSHTPEVCLTAAGHQLEVLPDMKVMTLPGMRLPFRAYSFRTERGPVFVFYCLWEDRRQSLEFDTESLTYGSRWAAVREGRRNLGQRSLEVAISGLSDLPQAEAALQSQLEKLIQVPAAGKP